MKRVLLTGMSGTGKTTIVDVPAARGYDAVSDDWHERGEGSDWIWRADRIEWLLSIHSGGTWDWMPV